MIDFHAHILPNVDDGSRSVEETFNMIKEAKEAGFEAIVSTSHYMEGSYEVENRERAFWIKTIESKLKEQNINIKLYLGNEIYMTDNMIKILEDDKASTVNNTSYVLFELPLNVEPMNLYDVVFEMLRCKLVPVLAHPERYSFVQKDPELIYDLIQKGVLMQSNYGSFIGRYGKNAEFIVKKFLKNDMVHFFGSDAHREKTIYPKIPGIIKQLNGFVGEEKVKMMTETNPLLALNNKKIEIQEPTCIKISLKEKMLMFLKK